MQEDFLAFEHSLRKEADLCFQHQEVHIIAVLFKQGFNDFQSLVVFELTHQNQGFDVLLPLAVS